MYSTTKLHIACRAGVILASEYSVCGRLWQRKAGKRKKFLYWGGGRPRREFLIGVVNLQLSVTSQMCHLNMLLMRKMRKMASTVNCKVLSSDSAFEEALKCLEFNTSRALKSQQKEAICALVYGKDLLAVLPTGFRKSLIFRVLLRGNLRAKSSFFPLQNIVYDKEK